MDTQSPDHTRSVLILYGSETGNAQEVAEELGALAERLRFATHVSELNKSKPVSTIRRGHRCRDVVTDSQEHTGRAVLVHAHYLRCIDYRTRRSACEREGVLESALAEEASPDILEWGEFCNIRTWR